MSKIITIVTLDRALRAIVADDTVPGKPTGGPWYGGRQIEHVQAGMVPREITWDSDRGNWAWDGVCHMLEAMHVDPRMPL